MNKAQPQNNHAPQPVNRYKTVLHSEFKAKKLDQNRRRTLALCPHAIVEGTLIFIGEVPFEVLGR